MEHTHTASFILVFFSRIIFTTPYRGLHKTSLIKKNDLDYRIRMISSLP